MQRLAWTAMLAAALVAQAGEYPRVLRCYRGGTPTLDGVLAPGEWDDAATITGVDDWIPQFTPTTDPADLALRGWVKHDGSDLWFAFEVTDDVLYGLETDRWLPDENAQAHELTREGYPWLGDEMELLINAANAWGQEDGQNCPGDGSAWQMVCNLTKSRLGGIGTGGLLEGEPRQRQEAWDTYQRWILEHAMEAVAKVKPDQSGYVIEWRVKANPCLEVAPGKFWTPELGEVAMGLNIALGDLDERAKGEGNFGHFHHEDWWAGEKDKRTWLKQWGTLIVDPGPPPAAEVAGLPRPPARSASIVWILAALCLVAVYPTKTICGRFEQPVRRNLAEPPALQRLRELTDAYGHRYSIGADCFIIGHPSGEQIVYDRHNGLPFGHLQCLAQAPGGDIWIGGALGVLRFAGGRFEVYAGQRWLPDDRVTAIAADDAGATVVTRGGACRIELTSMEFAEKAAEYEAQIDARHRRLGYVTGCTLAEPGDLSSWRSHTDDNDGLWTAMYLAAEAYRYAAGGESEAREKASAALEALLDLERRTPIDGFPARSLCRRGEAEFGNHHDGEWHATADADWEWKADTSSDELDGHYFAWGVAYDLFADRAQREAIADVCRRVTEHLVDNGFYLCDLDGKPTRWGIFGPASLNSDPHWFAERGLNSLELLSYLKTAAHVCGEPRYEAAYRELIESEHYALNIIEQKVMPGDFEGAECNHSDDELAYLSYYNLIRYEHDPALRAIYIASLERSQRFEWPEACPLWNFLYGGLTGRPCDVDGALTTLREVPLDLIEHETRNSHRWDVEIRDLGDRFGRAEAVRPLSFRERPMHKWNGNPYRLDGGSGRSEECGTFWLIAYWLGRYHEIIG